MLLPLCELKLKQVPDLYSQQTIPTSELQSFAYVATKEHAFLSYLEIIKADNVMPSIIFTYLSIQFDLIWIQLKW